MRDVIERYLDRATERELTLIYWFIRGLMKKD